MSEEWMAGALAEHEAHDEGLSKEVIGARNLVADLARCWHEDDPWPVLAGVQSIYAADQPFRERFKIALRLLRS